jgi:hypothetical protein
VSPGRNRPNAVRSIGPVVAVFTKGMGAVVTGQFPKKFRESNKAIAVATAYAPIEALCTM